MRIYEYNGESYIRQGECVRCGMCCTGWSEPCPYLRWDTPNYSTCLIYDESYGRNRGAPCAWMHEFPDGPQAQWHPAVRNKCGYYFTKVEKILVAAPTHNGKNIAKKIP